MKITKLISATTAGVLLGVLTSCGNSHNAETATAIEAPADTVEEEVVEVVEAASPSEDESYTVSSGYSTDPNYRPTVSDDGDYHTIDGKRRQIQYQGSQEQQRDLDMIDEYMRTHPEY